MNLFEVPQINPAVPVREQLFEAVHTIAATDGPLLFDRQTSFIPYWDARYGDAALRNLHLSRPLHEGRFEIVSAEVIVPHQGEEFAITIDKAAEFAEQGTKGYSFDRDFIARNVLRGLLQYVQRHPHSSCMGFYRGLRLKDKGLVMLKEAADVA